MGGNPKGQLIHLKSHLEFQKQDKGDRARINWCTVITRAQSRRHITKELHRKINWKMPGFLGNGKLDTEEGQQALHTTSEFIKMRVYHGGNGFHLIGWNLRFRMFRERSRRRGLPEEAFWDIIEDADNRPRMERREQSFPTEIQYRLALRRQVMDLIKMQGANPRHHKDAVGIQVHECRLDNKLVREEETDEKGKCPHCELQLNSLNMAMMAFDPGDPPILVEPGSWRKQPWRSSAKEEKRTQAVAAGQQRAA